MSPAARVDRSRRQFANVENRYGAKRERLVRCARSLAEQRNATRISITDVTDELGITRGLFYYYFDGKEELNEAIIQSYVEDMMKGVEATYDTCTSREELLNKVIESLRDWLYYNDGEKRPIWHVVGDLKMVDQMLGLATDKLADFFVSHGLLVKYGKLSDEYLYEHARLVSAGIIGEIRMRPDVSTDLLHEAACSSLRYRKRREPSQEESE